VQNLRSCDTQLLTGLNAESNSVPICFVFHMPSRDDGGGGFHPPLSLRCLQKSLAMRGLTSHSVLRSHNHFSSSSNFCALKSVISIFVLVYETITSHCSTASSSKMLSYDLLSRLFFSHLFAFKPIQPCPGPISNF